MRSSRRLEAETARNLEVATIKGFEVMRMFKKGQFTPWIEAIGGGTEASCVNRLFGIYA